MPNEHKSRLPSFDNFAADVYIRIFLEGSRYTADIQFRGMRPQRIPIGITQSDLEDFNAEIQQAIEQVSGSVGEDGVDYGEALARLAKKGNLAFKSIFAEGRPREIIQKGLKLVRNPRKTEATIEFASEDFFIPWELLYDGPLGKQVDVSCFWGIRHIISQIPIPRREDLPSNLVSPIIRTSCPRVGLIVYNNLDYVVGKEIPILQGLQDQRRIQLLLLRELDDSRHDEELEELGRFLGNNLHIAHLACDARVINPRSQSYILISDEFPITLEEFRLREFKIKYNPLIILNACLTGTINPLYTFNWAALFWERGVRGILATEFHVPDWFAADFIEEVYTQLLSGKPIGVCLWTARFRFWNEHRNPLGLAYALYSPLGVRIAK